jgi:hypothetical protein
VLCRRFTCNVCDLMNDVPVDYYAGVDPATGRRTDEAQRPELACGSVEYVAPTEYMVSGRVWGLSFEIPTSCLCSVRKRMYYNGEMLVLY